MRCRRAVLSFAIALLAAMAALPSGAGAQAQDSTDSARARATSTPADTAPVAPATSPPDAGAPTLFGASLVTLAALGLSLIGIGIAASALKGVNDLSRRVLNLGQQVKQLSQQLSQQSQQRASQHRASQAARPESPPASAPPPQHASADVGDLRARVEDLEVLVERLYGVVMPTPLDGQAARTEVPDESAYTPFETVARPAPQADVQVLPGALSPSDEVRLTNSSRPMVQILWAPSASTAEVWVNPDYKFADLTADYLTSAFVVDAPGPGSYETVEPAVIAWSRGASAGRVQVRGRVRAAGG